MVHGEFCCDETFFEIVPSFCSITWFPPCFWYSVWWITKVEDSVLSFVHFLLQNFYLEGVKIFIRKFEISWRTKSALHWYRHLGRCIGDCCLLTVQFVVIWKVNYQFSSTRPQPRSHISLGIGLLDVKNCRSKLEIQNCMGYSTASVPGWVPPRYACNAGRFWSKTICASSPHRYLKRYLAGENVGR